MQQELELQQSETIPDVEVDYIRNAIQAEQSHDWSTLEEGRSLTSWVVSTLKSERYEEKHRVSTQTCRLRHQDRSPDRVVRVHIVVFSQLKISSGGPL